MRDFISPLCLPSVGPVANLASWLLTPCVCRSLLQRLVDIRHHPSCPQKSCSGLICCRMGWLPCGTLTSFRRYSLLCLLSDAGGRCSRDARFRVAVVASWLRSNAVNKFCRAGFTVLAVVSQLPCRFDAALIANTFGSKFLQ